MRPESRATRPPYLPYIIGLEAESKQEVGPGCKTWKPGPSDILPLVSLPNCSTSVQTQATTPTKSKWGGWGWAYLHPIKRWRSLQWPEAWQGTFGYTVLLMVEWGAQMAPLLAALWSRIAQPIQQTQLNLSASVLKDTPRLVSSKSFQTQSHRGGLTIH